MRRVHRVRLRRISFGEGGQPGDVCCSSSPARSYRAQSFTALPQPRSSAAAAHADRGHGRRGDSAPAAGCPALVGRPAARPLSRARARPTCSSCSSCAAGHNEAAARDAKLSGTAARSSPSARAAGWRRGADSDPGSSSSAGVRVPGRSNDKGRQVAAPFAERDHGRPEDCSDTVGGHAVHRPDRAHEPLGAGDASRSHPSPAAAAGHAAVGPALSVGPAARGAGAAPAARGAGLLLAAAARGGRRVAGRGRADGATARHADGPGKGSPRRARGGGRCVGAARRAGGGAAGGNGRRA
jgi:hypothetical protein